MVICQIKLYMHTYKRVCMCVCMHVWMCQWEKWNWNASITHIKRTHLKCSVTEYSLWVSSTFYLTNLGLQFLEKNPFAHIVSNINSCDTFVYKPLPKLISTFGIIALFYSFLQCDFFSCQAPCGKEHLWQFLLTLSAVKGWQRAI